MKMGNIIRKLCDKMGDIDILKTELDKQKIESANLKKELKKRRNENGKNISELKNEIKNLKKKYNKIM